MHLPPRLPLRSRHFSPTETLQVLVWLHDTSEPPMERFAMLSWLYADRFAWVEDGYLLDGGQSWHVIDGWRCRQPWGERIESTAVIAEVRPLSSLLLDSDERARLANIDFASYESALERHGFARPTEHRKLGRLCDAAGKIEDSGWQFPTSGPDNAEALCRFGLRLWAGRLKPLSVRHRQLPFSRRLDLQEVATLRRGYWPVDQDDRWVAWLTASHLRFWRSWTGHCIYELPIASRDEAGITFRELRVLDDRRRYQPQDDAGEVDTVNELIALAMGEPLEPYLPGFSGAAARTMTDDGGRA